MEFVLTTLGVVVAIVVFNLVSHVRFINRNYRPAPGEKRPPTREHDW